jgi:hypothetical protein
MALEEAPVTRPRVAAAGGIADPTGDPGGAEQHAQRSVGSREASLKATPHAGSIGVATFVQEGRGRMFQRDERVLKFLWNQVRL